MTNLRLRVQENAEKLQKAWTLVNVASKASGKVLPAECYMLWEKKASLHQTLAATAALFPTREEAWNEVQAVVKVTNKVDDSSNLIKHGNVEMPFSIARHLALTSYVAVTWSIYDRLANISARLAASSVLGEHLRQNPKVCEDFLDSKDSKNIFTFLTHFYLKNAYAWPIRVCYKIRNWLVHEGYEEGGTPLFKGDYISDGFILNNDAIDYLQRFGGYKEDNGKIDACCLVSEEEIWPTKNLTVILEKYHAEIDTMYEALLRWCVDSFVAQIAAFTERDKAALAVAIGGAAPGVSLDPAVDPLEKSDAVLGKDGA